jgi:hypothetical protein
MWIHLIHKWTQLQIIEMARDTNIQFPLSGFSNPASASRQSHEIASQESSTSNRLSLQPFRDYYERVNRSIRALSTCDYRPSPFTPYHAHSRPVISHDAEHSLTSIQHQRRARMGKTPPGPGVYTATYSNACHLLHISIKLPANDSRFRSTNTNSEKVSKNMVSSFHTSWTADLLTISISYAPSTRWLDQCYTYLEGRWIR